VSSYERIASEQEWRGSIFTAGVERFRHADGQEVSREKVWHVGAVAILPVDRQQVWLTRQPREVVGLSDSLEIPAGKRDVPDEPPLQTAKRELAEEIGKSAASWTEMGGFYSSAGFSDERMWWYVARELSDVIDVEPEDNERISIIPWPLDRLDDAIAECQDAKSLVALLWLAARLASGQAF